MNDLDWIYAGIPEVNCKGKCWRACANISVTPMELEAMREVRPTRANPHPMKKGWFLIVNQPNGQCPHLRRKKCRVYEARPGICRLFGVAEGMKCTKGCEPEHMLSRDEGSDVLASLESLEKRNERRRKKAG